MGETREHSIDEQELHALAREVERARREAAQLADRLGPDEREHTGVLRETLQSLEVAVEELDVAGAEMRQQHEALLESRHALESEMARFQDLFDAAPDAYFVTDRFGAIRQLNRAALSLLKTTPTFAMGKPIAVFAASEERMRLRTYLGAAAAGRAESAIALQLRPRAGDPVSTEVAVSALRDTHGNVSGLRWIVRDVTERRRAEERMRALAEELELRVQQRTAQLEVAARLAAELLDQERAARADADRAHERLAFLASAGAMLGETLELDRLLAMSARLAVPQVAELCAVAVMTGDGRVLLEVAHDDPALAPAARALRDASDEGASDAFGLRRVLRGGSPSEALPDEAAEGSATDGEIRETRDAARGVIASFVTLPLVAGGRALGAMVLATGVVPSSRPFPDEALIEDYARRVGAAVDKARLHAELRAAHERLTAESARKTSLFAVLSHEIRTPLQSIGGYAELMRLGVHGALSDRQAQDLDRIQTSQDHVLRIVDEVLEAVRMERGLLAVEPRPILLEEVLATVASMMVPQFADHGLTFVHRAGDPDLTVMADPSRLRQILLNLLGNAARYTPSGGTVVLEASAEGSVAHVRVLDTGAGIPAEKLESIFEPFTQLEKRLGPGSGVGLGLALSRNFARATGGDLTVESEVGAGSVFTLTLRRVEGGAQG